MPDTLWLIIVGCFSVGGLIFEARAIARNRADANAFWWGEYSKAVGHARHEQYKRDKALWEAGDKSTPPPPPPPRKPPEPPGGTNLFM